jgi:DNA-binding NtrC family response regulator
MGREEAHVKYLVAWIGRQDLEGIRHSPPTGPIVDFLRMQPAVTVVLLSDAERKHLSPDARKFAESYPWPGNVRELENTLARLFALVSGDSIRREHLQAHVIPTDTVTTTSASLSGRRDFSLLRELEAVERRWIEQALRETGGVKERAAKLLGMASRQALSHRMRRLGIG